MAWLAIIGGLVLVAWSFAAGAGDNVILLVAGLIALAWGIFEGSAHR